MAIASVGTIGGASDIGDTGSGNYVITTSAAAEVGNVVILPLGKDNVATSDGTGSEITSVADTGLNTWSALAQFVNGQGAANAGAYVAAILAKITTQINISDTITVTKSTDVDCASRAWEFTVGAGKTLQVASGGLQTLANDGADVGSMTISGLPSKEYLFLRVSACEHEEITQWTNTASYTNIPLVRSSAAGVGTTNIVARAEFIIATGTGHTSDPTLGAGETPDSASIFMALEEVDVASAGVVPVLMNQYRSRWAA